MVIVGNDETASYQYYCTSIMPLSKPYKAVNTNSNAGSTKVFFLSLSLYQRKIRGVKSK